MRKKQTTLGDVYGEMFKSVKTVVNENAQENINKSKKIPKMSKNAFNDKMGIQKGGPTEADGFHKALNDDYCGCDEEDNEEQYNRISKIEEKLKNPNLSDKEKASLEKILKNMKENMQREEAEENIVKESKKIARERLNTFMMKKSTFDKLFESVMGGEDAENAALGLSDAPTDDEFGDEDMGDEDMGDDQITVTLDRAVARQLCDILQAAMGGEEDYDVDMDDLDFGDEGEGDEMDEEGDEMYDEAEEYDEDEQNFYPTDEVGNDGTIGAKNSKDGSHKLQSKNNKVGGRPQPKNQGTKVTGTTDKVGNDGGYGHALHGAKQPNYGKQNKVSDYRQGEDYFR